MVTIELINESGLEFTDISSEEYRSYFRPSDFTIPHPQFLHVSKSGGHRIVDSSGKCYYIFPDGRRIEWKPNDRKPHFVK